MKKLILLALFSFGAIANNAVLKYENLSESEASSFDMGLSILESINSRSLSFLFHKELGYKMSEGSSLASFVLENISIVKSNGASFYLCEMEVDGCVSAIKIEHPSLLSVDSSPLYIWNSSRDAREKGQESTVIIFRDGERLIPVISDNKVAIVSLVDGLSPGISASELVGLSIVSKRLGLGMSPFEICESPFGDYHCQNDEFGYFEYSGKVALTIANACGDCSKKDRVSMYYYAVDKLSRVNNDKEISLLTRKILVNYSDEFDRNGLDYSMIKKRYRQSLL